jgi:hypothetical protein
MPRGAKSLIDAATIWSAKCADERATLRTTRGGAVVCRGSREAWADLRGDDAAPPHGARLLQPPRSPQAHRARTAHRYERPVGAEPAAVGLCHRFQQSLEAQAPPRRGGGCQAAHRDTGTTRAKGDGVLRQRGPKATIRDRALAHRCLRQAGPSAAHLCAARCRHVVRAVHRASPEGFLNEMCGRPDDERPFAIIVVGYPAKGCLVPMLPRRPFGDMAVFVE